MKRNSGMKTKWKWMTGLTAVLVVMFLVIFSVKYGGKIEAADGDITYELHNDEGLVLGSEYVMRRGTETISLETNDNNISTYSWQSMNTAVLDIDGSANGSQLKILAKTAGKSEVKLTITKTDGTVKNITVSIEVRFSINEYLLADDSSIFIKRIFADDERKALIMDTGDTIEFGTSAVLQTNKINLSFGSAAGSDASWTVGNKDIIVVNENTSPRTLKAAGAGRTTLSVSWSDGSQKEYTDTIEVYVRPKITYENDLVSDTQTTIGVSNGAIFKVSVEDFNNPLEAIGDKLVWVISKGKGMDKVLVRDSLGNGDKLDEANLEYQPTSKSFRLNAKAGKYNVQFYVKGTYKGFEEAKATVPGCEPVQIGNGVQMSSEFENKNVTVNINGTYDLSDAFNISTSVLSSTSSPQFFNVTVEHTDQKDSNDYISLDSEKAVIKADKGKTGVAVVWVEATESITNLDFGNEIPKNKKVKLTITIADTFTLNVANAKMSVGGELQLYGILGSDTVTESSQYEWEVSEEDKKYIDIVPSGSYATVKAKQATDKLPSGTVKVTLKLKLENGTVLKTSCNISIDKAATSFKIVPETLTMKVDEMQTIKTNLTGSTKLVWMTSDAKIATVEDSSADTPAAQLTAVGPGEVIITALNPANNVYATLVLTVEQPITELAVGIDGKASKTYTITLTKPYVFCEPIYEPKDATDKDFKWASSDTSVATVDETSGVVTVLKAGETDISVSCKDHTGYCRLYIKTQGLTSITPDVTELEMIVGDTYTVKTELLPKDATNTLLKWESKDESVAKVEGGKITANGVGTTYIDAEAVMAQDGKAARMPTIKVNVRKGLQSIALDSNSYYVPMGGKKQVTVVYTPDDSSINRKVKYKSSNEAIFKVDDKGLITPVKEGMAMLTVTPDELGADGAVTAIVYVTATEKAAKDFVISPEAAEIYIGDTLRLEKVFTPVDTTDQYVTWTTSDKSIATVNAAGIVTGVAAGETSITAVYNNTPDGKPWVRTSKIVVKPQPIHPTDFTVNPSTQNIKVNESFTLVPEFTPADTTNKNVEYQSLDEGVVKVDEKGKVTGVGAGDAIIQCQSEDGGFIATCAVHVENAVDFALSPAEKEIAVGRTFKITKIVSKANAKKTATWKSSNTAIATVDANGKVTAKRIGTCTITCKLSKYNQSASCKVKVRKLNSKVTLDKKNIRIGVGQTYKFKKTVWTNDTKNPAVLWRTSNKKVCSVNSFGKITGKKPGIVKITVMTKDAVHAKATCKVRVIQRVKSIRLNSDYMTLYVGRSKKLKATVNPKGATIKKLKFTSGDSKVARVMSSGKVRGISEGDTYITAKTTDGTNKKARCFVKVLDLVPTSSIVVAQSDLTMKKGDRAKLTYTVLPDNTSDNLKFASDNERVVKVDKKGKVTAVGTGNAVVTILAESGVSTTVNVNVVALNKTVLNMRQYDTETLIVQGTSSPITWYSENQRVASVENGKVLGRAIGSTNIYAYVNGCKLTCRVTITSVNS